MKQIFLAVIIFLRFTITDGQKLFADFEALQLEDTSGKLFNTASLLGETVYVDFWFTACAPCIEEIPYSKSLQQFFRQDTNVAFLSICIENKARKPVWKQLIQDKEMPGINLFYARNRPQKVNLLRTYDITFPTFILLNNEMKVIGYDIARPSEKKLIHWIISQGAKGFTADDSYHQAKEKSAEYKNFLGQLDQHR